jgi:hypothetical protein
VPGEARRVRGPPAGDRRFLRPREASFTGGVLIQNGGEGELRVEGRYGEVAGITKAAYARIRLGSGDVALNGLRGDSEIRLLLGSVTLGWTQ